MCNMPTLYVSAVNIMLSVYAALVEKQMKIPYCLVNEEGLLYDFAATVNILAFLVSVPRS